MNLRVQPPAAGGAPARPRVAVIGAGIAGLTAADALARDHDVTVYEAGDRPGGHANTVTVDDPAGPVAIDTGFIVLNDRNYPLFRALLDGLGVETMETAMGLSIGTRNGSFEFAGTARGVLAQPRNLARPAFLRMLRDQLRFNRDVKPMIGRPDSPSVAAFARDSGYSDWFLERILMPEVSAVWSSDPASVADFPVGFLAEFLENHGQLRLTGRPRWRTVAGGSRSYVDALVARIGPGRIRPGAPVRAVRRLPGGGVEVDAGGCPEIFDQVVIASHSDQALRILAEPSRAEREVLGAIACQPNEVALHTDASIMPRRRAAWASWNFHLEEGSALPTMTYWMNRLHRLEAKRSYFVSLNSTERLDPRSVLRTFTYAHPVMSAAAVAAQRRWGEISGADRIHYCGAYWRWGFHEDGCWSGLRAAEAVAASVRRSPARRLEAAA